MNEEWRSSVEGYEISNIGRFRRSKPGRKTFVGRIIKQCRLPIGYMTVGPTIEGRNVSMYIHDLVAAAFIGPKPVGYSVNHLDGVKDNNLAENLEYVTHAGNMRHAAEAGLMSCGEDHPFSKLTEASVVMLRRDRVAGMSFSSLARKYGVTIATAFNAAVGNSWKHVREGISA